MVWIGLALVLITSIIVKIFDKEIRLVHWRKVAVNTAVISGLVFIVVGIIQMFVK